MQNKKRDGKKQTKTDLEIFIATETGILSTLKRIRFTADPSNEKPKTIEPSQTKLVDFHMEISKKIDEVIQKNEQENTVEEKRIVEPRTTWRKEPQTPFFKTETNLENEFIEVETPTDNINNPTLTAQPNIEHQPFFVGPIKPKNISLFAVGDHSEDQVLTSFAKIRINKDRTKSNNKTGKKTNKKNGYTKVKNDYEEVQTELERKKQELEEMKRLAKEKEEELKRKEQERKEKEKKRLEEKKKREKEEEKLAKQRAIEKKKQEKLKAKEELKLAKEKERQEKLKAKEEAKLAKQREKELKEKEKLEALKAKELEKQKQKELAEKEKIKALKQKEREEKKKKQEKAKKSKKEKKSIGLKISFSKNKERDAKEKPVKKQEIKTLEKETETEVQPPEDDLVKAFEIIDDLLGKLPEEAIDEFVKSDDFEVYEKVVGKYKKK